MVPHHLLKLCSIRKSLKHDKGNFCPLPDTPMTKLPFLAQFMFLLKHKPHSGCYCQRRAPHVRQSEKWGKWTSLHYRREGNAQLLVSMNRAQISFKYGDHLGWPGQQATAWAQGNHLISRETSSQEKWKDCSNIHLLCMDARPHFSPSSGAVLIVTEVSKEMLLSLLQNTSLF